MLVQQINKILVIVQASGVELIEATKSLVNLVFDCFLPEMHEEVISDGKTLTAAIKKSSAKTGNEDATKALAPDGDSEYV
jgi:hypothetical protein